MMVTGDTCSQIETDVCWKRVVCIRKKERKEEKTMQCSKEEMKNAVWTKIWEENGPQIAEGKKL